LTRSRPYDVLVVGELNVDIILTGDVVPEFGQVEKLVDDLTVCAGASGGIFAASAAKMGLRVLYCSVVGDDPFGRFMLDALQAAGVDTSGVRVDPAVKTGVGVQLSTGQDRAMLTYLGSIAHVGPRDVPTDWSLARHLHVVSPFLLTGLRPSMPEMMARAHAAGMTVSLDTNWDPEERWDVADLLAHTDVLLPNENELRAIAGCDALDDVIRLMRERIPVLVVKRGERGALAFRGDECASSAALDVEVRDTTGAGDSFDGGFLAGWLRGESLQTCATLGAICGSLTTTQVGGFNGQPTWEEAMAVLERHCLGTGLRSPASPNHPAQP